MPDQSNKDLVMDFFRLITKDAYFTDDEGNRLTGEAESEMFRRTKKWRAEVWKKFYEIEERLCPRPAAQPRPDYVKQIAKESLGRRG